MEKPLISIIIPVYKVERYLEKILNLNKEYNLKDNYNNYDLSSLTLI